MINKWVCFFINSLTSVLYKREYLNFINIKDISKLQEEKLLTIIKANKDTEYGNKFDFSEIDTVKDYQMKVPLSSYEDYKNYIEKIKEGEENILTKEKVLLLEPTSGSTSASKYIPYTESLKGEFQKALKPWIYNLYSSYKDIKWGKSYWSVTPVTYKNKYTQGGVPIGFEEDGDYFGKFEKKLFNIIFAVDNEVAKINDIDEFYFNTSFQLLMTENLSLISVWNPTFLLLIIEYIEENIEDLCREIALKDKERAELIKKMVKKKDYKAIWKELKVISCWCDGNAEKYIKKVKNTFPHTIIQPKGLLATEAIISFPFKGEDGGRLAVNSHFFEFQSLKDGKIYLTAQLKKTYRYSVIVTSSGGLYRYKLNDIIEVTDIVDNFPLIKFIGKKDNVSDLFGEKLNEEFVKEVLSRENPLPEFFMLAPETDRYVLYIKAEKIPYDIDERIRENFHYDYCRKLGQLKEILIFKLSGNPEKEYIDGCLKHEQKIGDIKPTALSLRSGWDKIFKGEYI